MPKNGGTGKERTRSFPVSFPFPFFYRSLPGTSLTQICSSICFDYTRHELERAMDLHTSFVDTIKLNYKLAISTARDKNICQKIL